MNERAQSLLEEVFRSVFELARSDRVSGFRQCDFTAWDSLAHVTLIGALESEFEIQIGAADSLTLDSFEAVQAYLESLGR